ncbi:short-chain dehydrogenase/reductase SDR [Kribbella flavida DSM 17836]|uniref:Short-chain dehydrogenase/reductase SDR n=1 Tax=Kribbella flavida (strain DSM 17836 / JCM 10339 / NBRC 14399) TaxID=479435 RepID=D2PWS5_KRIFD|nr:SDR family oxidoreductase [Kribbella flavida]ADB33544.1 short-chain dehydrogenase/reductase SDR [Kribbella flavida DSM 17836]
MAYAVVTGASSGIGAAVARHLVRRGMQVLGVARRRDALTALGDGVEPVVADLRTDEGIAAVASAAAGRDVHAVVHAAGMDDVRSLAATGRAELEAVWALNVTAPVLLTGMLLPVLADGAGVVFVGSTSALRGIDRHAGYGASKAALGGLTVNLAAELAPRVRVNTVTPGGTRTPMTEEYLAAYRQGVGAEHVRRQLSLEQGRLLLGGLADPADVATTIAHVALDARAMTGSTVIVDGGFTAR